MHPYLLLGVNGWVQRKAYFEVPPLALAGVSSAEFTTKIAAWPTAQNKWGKLPQTTHHTPKRVQSKCNETFFVTARSMYNSCFFHFQMLNFNVSCIHYLPMSLLTCGCRSGPFLWKSRRLWRFYRYATGRRLQFIKKL